MPFVHTVHNQGKDNVYLCMCVNKSCFESASKLYTVTLVKYDLKYAIEMLLIGRGETKQDLFIDILNMFFIINIIYILVLSVTFT